MTRLGYHAQCGGAVSWFIHKTHRRCKRAKFYVYYRCSRCSMQGPTLPDLAPIGYRTLHQHSAGVKRRRPRYDIRSWKEVDEVR